MVFLDTVGLLAFWDKSGPWHPQAEPAYWELRRQGRVFFTTTFVLAECGNAAARRPYRAAVARPRLQLESEKLLVEPVHAEWEAAWRAYERGDADRAGIVDQISFIAMRNAAVRQAFTNDQHFRAAGSETLF